MNSLKISAFCISNTLLDVAQLEHTLLKCDADLATVKALLDVIRNVAY